MAPQGLAIERPPSSLFLDQTVYDYRMLDEFQVNAYWVGYYGESLDAGATLLRDGLFPQSERARIVAQLGLCPAEGHRTAEGRTVDDGTLEIGDMALKRMDNMGIVVDDLDATIDFFRELGLELEGRGKVEGEWAGRVTGLGDQHVEIAMMRTPDGHSRLELSRFLAPPVVADHRNAPVNALGYLRIMFAVDDLDDTLERLGRRGAQLVGDVVQYQDVYRLCYIRGPGDLLIGLAEELK